MRATVLATAICVSAIGLSSASDTEAAVRRSTNIPAQELCSALQTLAKEHNFQLIYLPEFVRDVRTAGAVGELTSEEALSRLLQGTGLMHRRLDEQTMTITALPSEKGGDKSRSGSRRGALTDESSDRGGEKESGGTLWSRFRLAQLNQGLSSNNGPAEDQSNDEQPSDERRRSYLEEVIVTAQKRRERLIDVPQAVSVVSADDLTRRGLLQLRDWTKDVPSMNIQSIGAGETILSLRGVTIGVDLGPTVGVYIDEVPYGSSSARTFAPRLGFDSSLFDLDRIEVLKGPQGTYYGASTMGGLIKYVTKPPSTESFSSNMQFGLAGTEDGGISYNAAATANIPITDDKLAVRATGFYSRDGGYIDNVALGAEDVNRTSIYGGRADLLFTPNEDLSIRLSAFLQDIDRNGEGTADFSFTGAPLHGSLAQNRQRAEPFEQRFRLVSATVAYDFDWAALTSITSYQTARTEFLQDASPFWVPYAEAEFGRPFSGAAWFNSGPTDKFVQELRLASEGSRPLEWVIGGFYNHEDTVVYQPLLLFDAAGNQTSDVVFTTRTPSVFEEYAGFGTLTWYVTDTFDLSGGVRFADYSEKFTQYGAGFSGSVPTTSASHNATTYLANARYHLGDRGTLYLRYATGYRPGGPNGLFFSSVTGLPMPDSYDSDELSSYEIGFKGETADRRFGIDLAAFQSNWDDIIVFVLRESVGFRSNALGGARVRGAELGLTARPTDAFTISGAFSYLDAYMREADADIGASKGERLPHVPRVSAALNADYRLPFGRFEPTVGATVRYVDERTASFDANLGFPQYHLPDYTTVDLRAGFTLGAVDAQLYARNIFDERGEVSALTWNVRPLVGIIQPRTIGISVTTSF